MTLLTGTSLTTTALVLLPAGIVASLLLAVTLVLAAAVAGLMAYHYAQARIRERRGFTFDPATHIARVITSGGSQKAVNAEHRGVAVLSQVDGARWLSLEGKSVVRTDAESVRDAELRYAQRYRTPRPNPKRVVIEVKIERVLGSSSLLDRSDS